MQILLLSDIHANFPALRAVEHFFMGHHFDYIVNCGDSVVYAPFPNETLTWLKNKKSISILGNTDKKVLKLLRGKSFNKPRDPEKKIMYQWTAEHLSQQSIEYLQSLEKKEILTFPGTLQDKSKEIQIGIYHGSPARNHEFLFDTTSNSRFLELSKMTPVDIVVCGHSHVPFSKYIGNTHFINPGSTGRMFDGDPRASCAVLQLQGKKVFIEHFRISYNINETVSALAHCSLPKIYQKMYFLGKKTN